MSDSSLCDAHAANRHRRRGGVGGGAIWLTEDIRGMAFLGEGLQLIVTPAVLSVAVPGVLHHLEKEDNTAAH